MVAAAVVVVSSEVAAAVGWPYLRFQEHLAFFLSTEEQDGACGLSLASCRASLGGSDLAKLQIETFDAWMNSIKGLGEDLAIKKLAGAAAHCSVSPDFLRWMFDGKVDLNPKLLYDVIAQRPIATVFVLPPPHCPHYQTLYYALLTILLTTTMPRTTTNYKYLAPPFGPLRAIGLLGPALRVPTYRIIWHICPCPSCGSRAGILSMAQHVYGSLGLSLFLGSTHREPWAKARANEFLEGDSMPKGCTRTAMLNVHAMHAVAKAAGYHREKYALLDRASFKAIVGHVGNLSMHFRVAVRSKNLRTALYSKLHLAFTVQAWLLFDVCCLSVSVVQSLSFAFRACRVHFPRFP